jgi:rod shape-determining protein MreD
VRAAAAVLAIAVTLWLQTMLPPFFVRRTITVDLVLVVVVGVGLASGPVMGLLLGACAGIVQDALAGGVIGIGGLAKTIVGFLTGIVGTQFIVGQPLPRFVIFFAATFVHAVVFIGLYELLDLAQFGTPYAAVTGQAVGNAIVGVVAFQVVEFLPGAVERRRASRGRLHR